MLIGSSIKRHRIRNYFDGAKIILSWFSHFASLHVKAVAYVTNSFSSLAKFGITRSRFLQDQGTKPEARKNL